MNYRKIVEGWLREYKEDKLSLEADKTLIYDMRNNVGSGIDISREATSKTNKFSSEVENLVIQIEKLEERMKAKERKVYMLNEALSKLDGRLENARRIIELRYMYNAHQPSWNQICRIMNYEYSWTQELKLKGLNKLVEILFPDRM